MPYRICKAFEIEAGHMLSKHPDLCKFPHGHSRNVEILLESDTLDQSEMVCDLKVLGEILRGFTQSWDHAMCMNTRDPHYATMKAAFGDRIVGFDGIDPTTEVMAKMVFDEMKRRLSAYLENPTTKYPLSKNVRIVSVRIWETSTSWAEYAE